MIDEAMVRSLAAFEQSEHYDVIVVAKKWRLAMNWPGDRRKKRMEEASRIVGRQINSFYELTQRELDAFGTALDMSLRGTTT